MMVKTHKPYFYGAYGSNLNVGQMAVRCPNAIPVTGETLDGWRLVFRGVADIVPDASSSVQLGLWLITDECEKALDRYEGFPRLYTKEFIELKTEERSTSIMIYRMTDDYAINPPTPSYLSTITHGYDDFDLDREKLTLPIQHSYNKERVISMF